VGDLLRERLARVARFDATVFEEVAADETATGSALIVLLGACALDALGSGGGLEGTLLGLAAAAFHMGLWILAIQVGARGLDLGGELAPLFRALGFAAAPLAVGLLRPLPLLGELAGVARWLLVLIAFSLAAGRVLRSEGATPWVLVLTALGAAALLERIVF